MLSSPPTTRPSRLRLATFTLALASMAGLAQAQMGPGGGPPGGMPPAGGKGPSSQGEQRMPTLDDLLPPDPWRIWLERLQLESQGLELTDAQQPAFRAFVRELDEAARLNGVRVLRGLRRAPSSVSATVDVGRDLRQEADDAKDWLNALADLSARWDALRQVLTPAQQAKVDAMYRASREAARQAPKEGAKPPAR